MADAQVLYDSLKGEAEKFANVSTLGLDDVRQNLFVLCLEHATGQDAYNPLLGPPRAYIMGRMWGLVERWRPMQRLDDESDDDNSVSEIPDALKSPAVDVELMAAAQRKIVERIRDDLETSRRVALAEMPTIAALHAYCGRSERDIAKRWKKGTVQLREAVRFYQGSQGSGA